MAKEPDDIQLVRQAAGGDREAYRILFDKYHSRVVSLAFDVLRSREEAQDVAQEAFVKAYLSLPEFKGDSTFYTWLYRIAYNLSVDVKRKITRRGGPTAEFEEAAHHESEGLVGHLPSPHAALYQKQQNVLIKEALATLTEEHRTTIVLREVDGFSYDEIAKITGASLGTVMSRLFYARKKLQKALHELNPLNQKGDQGGDGDAEGGGPTTGSRGSGSRRGGPRLGLLTSGKKNGGGRILQRVEFALIKRSRPIVELFRGCRARVVNIFRVLCVRETASQLSSSLVSSS